MAGQRGFFSWWFGELREVFSGRPVPVHALAMSDREIALIEKGVDTPLGVVNLEASDWMEQIEGLRSRILRRKRKNPMIEIQLPSEQVMYARVVIDPAADRQSAVREKLPELTGQPLETLVFDVASKPDAEGRTVVAVAPSSTVTEAAHYASEWGFDPVRITSIESPHAFRRGPEFKHEGTRIAGSVLPKVAAGLAVLALCLGGAATARTLSVRADLADKAVAEAAALPVVDVDIGKQELALAQFANAAATATDVRDVTMPVWRIIAEVASIIPSDVILDGFEYRSGQLVLRGTTKSTVSLEEALDRSPIFNAPTFSGTSRGGGGRAKFTVEATVDERSIR
jgi:hypothetical protein